MGFVEKLRLNNLYPSVPVNTGEDQLYNQFQNQVVPAINSQNQQFDARNRIPQVAVAAALPQQPIGDGRPGNLTNMNVQYKAPLSDQVATNILGVQQDPVSEYQKGELANRQADLQLKRQALGQKSELDTAKLGVMQNRAATYKYKAEHPDAKIVVQRGGNIKAIDPVTGALLQDLGPSGEMDEAEKIALEQTNAMGRIGATGAQERQTEGVRQAGRESLSQMSARHAEELATLNASLKPNGSSTTTNVTGPNGENLGTRTSETTSNKASTVMMYGPNGEGPHPIPIDKIQDAKSTYKMSFIKPVPKAKGK